MRRTLTAGLLVIAACGPIEQGATPPPPAIAAPQAAPTQSATDYHLRLSTAEIASRRIRVTVETNFPDGTKLHISAGRLYYEQGSTDAYSGNMFDDDISVVGGTIDLEIPINDDGWMAEREAKKPKLQKLGLWSEIERMSPDVTVRALYSSMRPQSERTRAVLGQHGEYVTGAQSQKFGNDKTLKASATINMPFVK